MGDEQKTDSIVEAVRNDLLQRSQLGIAKYGVTLDRTDLSFRDWLQHAYEEALDLANYLKRTIVYIDSKGGSVLFGLPPSPVEPTSEPCRSARIQELLESNTTLHGRLIDCQEQLAALQGYHVPDGLVRLQRGIDRGRAAIENLRVMCDQYHAAGKKEHAAHEATQQKLKEAREENASLENRLAKAFSKLSVTCETLAFATRQLEATVPWGRPMQTEPVTAPVEFVQPFVLGDCRRYHESLGSSSLHPCRACENSKYGCRFMTELAARGIK